MVFKAAVHQTQTCKTMEPQGVDVSNTPPYGKGFVRTLLAEKGMYVSTWWR